MSRTPASSRKAMRPRSSSCRPGDLSPVVRALSAEIRSLRKLITDTQALLQSRAGEPALSFTIPDDAWQDASISPTSELPTIAGSRLHASITINGIGFHCEALEVEVAEFSGVLVTKDERWESTLVDYYQASGAEGIMQRMRIKGREYAVFLTPHC